MIYLNTYYKSQPTTGQQRYAHELCAVLSRDADYFRELAPSPLALRTRGTAWAELQIRGALRLFSRHAIVSLTARAPFFASPHIPTIHDLFPITHPEWYSPSYAVAHAALLRHHLEHSRAIITVSDPMREEISRYARSRIPICVVPNAAADCFSPKPLSTAERVALKLGEGGFFLSVSSIEPRKNLDVLIAAHRLLPSEIRSAYPLVLVGSVSPIFGRVRALSDADDTIRFVGRVTDECLSRLYSSTSAFVSVSKAEGFGIPVVEAVACGARLIISDIPVHRWVTGGAGTFVDPDDSHQLRDALLAHTGGAQVLREPDTLTPYPAYTWEASAEIAKAFLLDVAHRP